MVTGQLAIEAVVAEGEQPALHAAASQLDECMHAATGNAWPVIVNFRTSLDEVQGGSSVVAVIVSMLGELNRHDVASTSQRLRRALPELASRGLANVFLCTIFRHVPRTPYLRPSASSDASSDAPSDALLERIRRLNLLAIELSHDTGVAICDIDRTFAHLGARGLKTDYRHGGEIAAEVAAYTIVAGVLELAMDDLAGPDVIERARHFHGSPWEINQLLRRRLAAQPHKAQTLGSYKPSAVDAADPGV